MAHFGNSVSEQAEYCVVETIHDGIASRAVLVGIEPRGIFARLRLSTYIPACLHRGALSGGRRHIVVIDGIHVELFDLSYGMRAREFNTQYKDTGLFGVYAVGMPTKQQDLMYYIMESE